MGTVVESDIISKFFLISFCAQPPMSTLQNDRKILYNDPIQIGIHGSRDVCTKYYHLVHAFLQES